MKISVYSSVRHLNILLRTNIRYHIFTMFRNSYKTSNKIIIIKIPLAIYIFRFIFGFFVLSSLSITMIGLAESVCGWKFMRQKVTAPKVSTAKWLRPKVCVKISLRHNSRLPGKCIHRRGGLYQVRGSNQWHPPPETLRKSQEEPKESKITIRVIEHQSILTKSSSLTAHGYRSRRIKLAWPTGPNKPRRKISNWKWQYI